MHIWIPHARLVPTKASSRASESPELALQSQPACAHVRVRNQTGSSEWAAKGSWLLSHLSTAESRDFTHHLDDVIVVPSARFIHNSGSTGRKRVGSWDTRLPGGKWEKQPRPLDYRCSFLYAQPEHSSELNGALMRSSLKWRDIINMVKREGIINQCLAMIPFPSNWC